VSLLAFVASFFIKQVHLESKVPGAGRAAGESAPLAAGEASLDDLPVSAPSH